MLGALRTLGHFRYSKYCKCLETQGTYGTQIALLVQLWCSLACAPSEYKPTAKLELKWSCTRFVVKCYLKLGIANAR